MYKMRNRERILAHASLVLQVPLQPSSYQLCKSLTEAIDDRVNITFAVRGILVCLRGSQRTVQAGNVNVSIPPR